MANALIAYANTIDGATLSAGNWLSTLPLANLKNRTIGKVARSVDASNSATRVTADNLAVLPIRTVGIVNHNLSISGKYRVRFSNDAGFASLIADSGWIEAWPSVYNSLDLSWGSDNFWGGKYTDRDRKGYTWTSIYSADATLNARYVSVEFDDTSNSSGYIQFGRLFIGDAWQPRINMLLGASLGWETGTEVQEAVSGAEYFNEKRPYRVAKFTTGYMDIDEGLGRAFDIQRRTGISGEVIFVFDPADTLHKLRRQFYGRLRQLSAIEYPYPTLVSTPWEIKESL